MEPNIEFNPEAGVFFSPDPLPDDGGNDPPPGDPGSGGHAPTRPSDDEDDQDEDEQ